jgi:metal-responsive CopG/Arc/MetJ family transcriptional regulator
MRIAISIPDDVFERIERLARRAGCSRSEVFSASLSEYVARHAADEVTDAMDRVIANVDDSRDAFSAATSRHLLAKTEW